MLLDAGGLDVPPEAGHELMVSRRGHAYVEVRWPGVSGQACWDTGASTTIVNRDFWLAHPGLFEQAGMSAGTDLILGYPTIRQADWLFDFPARRWTLTSQ